MWRCYSNNDIIIFHAYQSEKHHEKHVLNVKGNILKKTNVLYIVHFYLAKYVFDLDTFWCHIYIYIHTHTHSVLHTHQDWSIYIYIYIIDYSIIYIYIKWRCLEISFFVDKVKRSIVQFRFITSEFFLLLSDFIMNIFCNVEFFVFAMDIPYFSFTIHLNFWCLQNEAYFSSTLLINRER